MLYKGRTKGTSQQWTDKKVDMGTCWQQQYRSAKALKDE